jgi:hypothetical protein
MRIRNQRISELNADAARAQAEARMLREEAKRLERRDMEEAHVDGWHDDVRREFCPLCEELNNRTNPPGYGGRR